MPEFEEFTLGYVALRYPWLESPNYGMYHKLNPRAETGENHPGCGQGPYLVVSKGTAEHALVHELATPFHGTFSNS